MTARITQKITPFLWFNDQAEEAVNFYTSLFDDSKIENVVRSPLVTVEAETAARIDAALKHAGLIN